MTVETQPGPRPRAIHPQALENRRRPSAGLQLLLHRSQLLLLAVIIPTCFATAGYGLVTDNAGFIYCSIATIMFMVPALIGLSRAKFDIFEPINIAAFSILFGTTLRSFYLLFAASRPRAKFLMMEQNFEEINSRVFIVLMGIFLFCVGYCIRIKRFPLERMEFIRGYRLSRSNVILAILLSISITFIGIFAFFIDFHIHISDSLTGILSESRKRTAEYVTSGGKIVYGAGWETVLAEVAQYMIFIYSAGMFAKIIRVTAIRLFTICFLFFLFSLVPFLTSTRTSIILVLFSLCVLGYYFNRLSLRSAIIGFSAVVFIVAGMGSIRAAGRISEGSNIVDFTIGSGNGFDTVRTTAIIDRVPRDHKYKYGSSYIVIPFFFVPRALWPDKPEVGLGAWVKRVLFHQKWVENAGWPPSMVGEAWINFGFIGVLVIPFLVGILFRLIYESCRPLLGKSIPVTVVYSVAAYKLGFNCVELDLSAGLVQTFTMIVPLIGFLWLSRSHAPIRPQRVSRDPLILRTYGAAMGGEK